MRTNPHAARRIPRRALEGGRIIAYGMLRGWSEGYAIPSLGIAVLPECRRRGVARQLMHHLHEVAADRGAASVRLTVYRENRAASLLYESFGYRLTPCSDHELRGHLSLSPTLSTSSHARHETDSGLDARSVGQ